MVILNDEKTTRYVVPVYPFHYAGACTYQTLLSDEKRHLLRAMSYHLIVNHCLVGLLRVCVVAAHG